MKSDEYEALRRELDTMLAIQAGQTAMLMALMRTYPRHDDLQMASTNALETMLGKLPATALTPTMRETARAYVESLQQLHPADPGAPGAKARLALSPFGS